MTNAATSAGDLRKYLSKFSRNANTSLSIYLGGGHEINMSDRTLSNDQIVDLAREMASLPELQSLTFENNVIQDEDAICALFTNLRGFERLENLNIRQNKFTFNMVNALATGI